MVHGSGGIVGDVKLATLGLAGWTGHLSLGRESRGRLPEWAGSLTYLVLDGYQWAKSGGRLVVSAPEDLARKS